jgi:hypothetical protein
MTVRKFVDWHDIFLDTSIILAYFRSLRDDQDVVCNFVGKLIHQLVTQKSSANRERNFYISSITISEILEKSQNETKAAKIVRLLNSDHVNFHPFDNDVAEYMVKSYHKLLGTENLSRIAKELSWPEHELKAGRQWIEKDLMILATAQYLECDTILTIDKNTMIPLAEKVGYFAASCYPENFELSENGKTIFHYNRPKAKKVVKREKKP